MALTATFVSSSGLDLAIKLVILVLIAIWAALVFWTYADSRRRIEDPMLIACATAASLLFPFVGTIVYAIVRPPEYLEDARERELEIAAAQARLHQVEQLACPYCDFEIEKTFLRCPSCLRRLKEPCGTCGRPLDPRWKICPYCEAEVGQAAPQRRQRARRTAGAPASAAAERQSARTPVGEQRPPREPSVARTPAPPRSQPPPPRGSDRTAERPAATRSRPPSSS